MRETSLLGLLFQTHYAELRNLITRKFNRSGHEAEDIVQDAFHNVLRNANAESLENPKAYLYQAAQNLALNRIRQQRSQQAYANTQSEIDGAELDEISPERQLNSQQDLQRLQNALTELPEKYRQTFLLSRVHEKSYKQISQELNIAESTVEKHIIKTLKYLREQLALDVIE